MLLHFTVRIQYIWLQVVALINDQAGEIWTLNYKG